MGQSQSTAIININPDADERIISLYQEAQSLQRYAEVRVISSIDDIKSATNDLSIMSGLKKTIEDKRKEYVGPINDHLKAVNEAFKTFTDPLNNADSITRQKILDYRAEQERQRQEIEEIAKLEREAAERKAALTGEPVVIPEVVEAPAVAPKHYRTDMGTLGTAKIWKFEVVDFSLLPDRFKMENAALIGKVVRAGEREIPGVRIWEERTLRITTKE